MEEKIKELGNYINKLREERKLGFNQLAKKSGVNVKTLNDIINGKAKRISPAILIKLATALRIHYKYFYWIVNYLDVGDDIQKLENHKVEITKNDNLIDLSLLDEEEKKILKSIYDLLLQKKWSSKKRPY